MLLQQQSRIFLCCPQLLSSEHICNSLMMSLLKLDEPSSRSLKLHPWLSHHKKRRSLLSCSGTRTWWNIDSVSHFVYTTLFSFISFLFNDALLNASTTFGIYCYDKPMMLNVPISTKWCLLSRFIYITLFHEILYESLLIIKKISMSYKSPFQTTKSFLGWLCIIWKVHRFNF